MFHRRRLIAFSSMILFAACLPASSQADVFSSGWSPLSGHLAAKHAGRAIEVAPRVYRAFTLDQPRLRTALDGAPLENTPAAVTADPVIVSIPAPDGVLQQFRAIESPVMEPGLAAKVPSFASYSVVGIDDPTGTGRIDVSSLGFHASIRSDRGAWYVDPAYRDRSAYVTYTGSALDDVHGAFGEDALPKSDAAQATVSRALPAGGSPVSLRTYRMALASDPGYAAFVGAANVDTAKAAVINRTDEIYNDDLAFRFVLVADNDLLDFNTEAQLTAACGAGHEADCYQPDPTTHLVSCSNSLDPNEVAIDHVIGDANYDIGHILTTDGAGLAAKGAGEPGSKAIGCSGITTPVGDILAVEFFAHEVAHQFGATHAFDAGGPECAANRAADGAIEPGSGSTIMSYAGVCGRDNIQDWSDPYFNQLSITQMQDYAASDIPGATNGGAVSATSNTSPVVTVPAPSVIPPRTPFTLTGSATDANAADVPVYIWEQDDLGDATGKVFTDNNKPDGPLFRQFGTAAIVPTYTTAFDAPGESNAKTTDNTRTFPDMAQVAVGNTNAATGSCPTADLEPTPEQVECFSEFLPTTARTLHFDLVARDRNPAGGGVSTAQTTVTVVGTTPFQVTAPAATTVDGNRDFTLTWNVAGTTAAPVSVANVRVSYSTDGGLTFPTEVLASTANDGSATFTMPNTATSTGRFKVEAIGQPFFDISHADLTVTPNTPLPTPTPTATATPTAPTTVAPTPTTTPEAVTVFRPVLTGLPAKVKPSRRGGLKLMVSCAPVDPASTPPAVCEGGLRLTARLHSKTRTIAKMTFALGAGEPGKVPLRVSRRARKRLRKHTVNATVVATVGTESVSRALGLRARR